MRTNRMTERIAFVSYESKKVNGVPVGGVLVKHMTVWAEVPKVPIRVGHSQRQPDFFSAIFDRRGNPTNLANSVAWEGISNHGS